METYQRIFCSYYGNILLLYGFFLNSKLGVRAVHLVGEKISALDLINHSETDRNNKIFGDTLYDFVKICLYILKNL